MGKKGEGEGRQRRRDRDRRPIAAALPPWLCPSLPGAPVAFPGNFGAAERCGAVPPPPLPGGAVARGRAGAKFRQRVRGKHGSGGSAGGGPGLSGLPAPLPAAAGVSHAAHRGKPRRDVNTSLTIYLGRHVYIHPRLYACVRVKICAHTRVHEHLYTHTRVRVRCPPVEPRLQTPRVFHSRGETRPRVAARAAPLSPDGGGAAWGCVGRRGGRGGGVPGAHAVTGSYG